MGTVQLISGCRLAMLDRLLHCIARVSSAVLPARCSGPLSKVRCTAAVPTVSVPWSLLTRGGLWGEEHLFSLAGCVTHSLTVKACSESTSSCKSGAYLAS